MKIFFRFWGDMNVEVDVSKLIKSLKAKIAEKKEGHPLIIIKNVV